jgi:RHS repeat-associated protein
MPGRSGHSGSGGWVSSSGTSTLPASVSYDSPRTTGSPAEYRATVSIEFLPGFESREVDAFEAYITTDNGSGNGGTGDPGYAGGGYRYGFNGKENDDEISTQDYGMRIYDPRLGRFLSVDPLAKEYPWNSPYAFAENDPINFIDRDGEEKAPPIPGWIKFRERVLYGNVQATKDFIINSARAHGISNPYDQLPRMGRIFEGAILRSEGKEGMKRRIYPYQLTDPGKYFIPDAIESHRSYVIKDAKTTIFKFNDAVIHDVKFTTRSELPLEPNYNPEQIKGFIDYLADVRGVTINGVYHNDKVSDYGVASLILETPWDVSISNDILDYAKKKNVNVFQKVAVGVTPLNSGGVSGGSVNDAINNNKVKITEAFQLSAAENKRKDVYNPGGPVKLNSNSNGGSTNVDWSKK